MRGHQIIEDATQGVELCRKLCERFIGIVPARIRIDQFLDIHRDGIGYRIAHPDIDLGTSGLKQGKGHDDTQARVRGLDDRGRKVQLGREILHGLFEQPGPEIDLRPARNVTESRARERDDGTGHDRARCHGIQRDALIRCPNDFELRRRAIDAPDPGRDEDPVDARFQPQTGLEDAVVVREHLLLARHAVLDFQFGAGEGHAMDGDGLRVGDGSDGKQHRRADDGHFGTVLRFGTVIVVDPKPDAMGTLGMKDVRNGSTFGGGAITEVPHVSGDRAVGIL